MKRMRVLVLELRGRRRMEAKYAVLRIATVERREMIVVWSMISVTDLGACFDAIGTVGGRFWRMELKLEFRGFGLCVCVICE